MHGEAVDMRPLQDIATPVAKDPIAAVEVVDQEAFKNDADPLAAVKSSDQDIQDMRRMGRTQQLVRHFRFLSIASFVAICTAAWELGLFLITPALVDGGRPALIYNVIWNFIGFGPIYLSMAEMASMAPICGAQYHWVSEFAPESMQRILSYFTGWTSTVAWQAGNALGVFLVGTLIQSIISINNPSYTFPAWHATLLVIAAVVIAYVGNVYGSRILPYAQNTIFVVHCIAYFAIIIPTWVNAPRATHTQVWTEWNNSGGWSHLGLAVLIGQLSGISNMVGIDTAAHMSEEVADAAYHVPRAMIAVYLINMILIFPAVITLAYHIPSVPDALNDPTLYPAIYVLRHSMSTAWLTVVLTITILLLICSNISYLAAVTRDLFAFARDQGFPFSRWIARVDSSRHIPVHACILTSIFSILLALIYVGSPVAFYAITSLLTVALLQCYCFSIGCLLWRRIAHPETLPPAKFSLGRWGIPVNALAVVYAFWAFFWSFWPQYMNPSAADFNWASVIFVGVLIGAAVHFAFIGRKKYVGPVNLVEGRKAR